MGGSLTEEEIVKVKSIDRYNNLRFMVEGGTYKAVSTLIGARHFEHVYTTEIHEGLHLEATELVKKEGFENTVTLLKGDTINLLKDIVPQVTQGALFFLDAHVSGTDSSWNQVDHVPLLKELEIILDHKIGPSVFICDDLRFWTTVKAWDWMHISNEGILKMFTDRGYEVINSYEENDRFWVFI
jgi:hypothetical protein